LEVVERVKRSAERWTKTRERSGARNRKIRGGTKRTNHPFGGDHHPIPPHLAYAHMRGFLAFLPLVSILVYKNKLK